MVSVGYGGVPQNDPCPRVQFLATAAGKKALCKGPLLIVDGGTAVQLTYVALSRTLPIEVDDSNLI